MICFWCCLFVLMWLDFVDEMGVLVVGSFVFECMIFFVLMFYLFKWVEYEVK